MTLKLTENIEEYLPKHIQNNACLFSSFNCGHLAEKALHQIISKNITNYSQLLFCLQEAFVQESHKLLSKSTMGDFNQIKKKEDYLKDVEEKC